MNFFFNSLIIYVFLSGCLTTNQKKCSISVFNNSSEKIDSIKITTYGLNMVFNNLSPDMKAKKVVSIEQNRNGEGAFLISIYIKDSVVGQGTFGYYFVYSDIKPKYDIEIQKNFSFREK